MQEIYDPLCVGALSLQAFPFFPKDCSSPIKPRGERVIALLQPLSFQSNLYNEQTILQARSTTDIPGAALCITKDGGKAVK